MADNQFVLKDLPPQQDVETKAVLKQAAKAHRYLAELKGVSKTIPNQAILIEKDLGVHRQTAFKYLVELAKGGFLRLEKIGKHHFYINESLFQIFSRK